MSRIIIGLGAILGLLAVTAAGWYYRPWSEYSPAEIQAATANAALAETFRDMGEVFPFRTISAGENGESFTRQTRNDTVGYTLNGQDRDITDWLSESDSTGLMVLHNGEVVHEEYLLGSTPETLHTSWSVGKSFVATLIAMALHEGRIDNLDQNAEVFAPQLAGSPFGETSLRHLLMMSAGVDFNEDYSAPDSDIRRLFLGANIWGRNIDSMVTEIERDREPGEDLHYVSANTQVLSAVARGVYDAPLARVVEDKIWRPIGMTSDANWNQNLPGENGIAIGYCCLNATLEDYARFGQFYLQDGVWNGERLVPEGWVDMATRPNADFQEPDYAEAPYPLRGYGLHFWVPEGYDGEYFMAGVYGQYVWVDTRRNIVIARTAADPEWGARTEESLTAMRALAAHYGGPVEADAGTIDAAPIDTETEDDTEENNEPGDEGDE
ncbi:serine hydrolase [Maricaulis sp.]|uniref:serine hydrolase domain-containing protein n=1 Tax=Maricaulis sp. TaxID=1486257 RepID=UPI00261F773C|nr:serine hydrolase [Maricaulis sp.]